MQDQIENTVRAGLLGGTTATTLGWVASVDWMATVGVCVLVFSFGVNWFFKRREDQRKQEKHVVEMALLKKDL